ncbi:MAG: VIT and VWA domain-containing protein [Deltaproteobacteria bacterium]|nr:VIT and VWA domain-containing protein [Deltaproteobacteria bacterium]
MAKTTTLSSLFIAAALTLSAHSAAAQSSFEARTEAGAEANMPLVDERITAVVSGQYSRTTIRQTYENRSKDRLEGRYIIKAGEGARVQGFSYWNGEKKIVGEVFEKQIARQVYEEVTGLGRDPGLLEQVGEGAFSFRVFPIAGGEKKPIEVTLGKWLPRSAGVVEYRMPVGLAGASIRVSIDDARGITGLSSPTHKITSVKSKGGQIEVRATAPKGQSKEFVLRYSPVSKPWQLSGYVHKDKGHDGYLAVTLATPRSVAASKVTAKDVTIVLDRSGSMDGPPLEHAKLAAKAVVSRLGKGDRINVVLFDDTAESLYKLPKAADDKVKAEALAYIDKVQDGGGTDIAGALRYAMKAQRGDALPNVILFLTDGQSSAQQALAAAKSDKSDARLFTIGVGSGVEKPLLSRLAKQKRGRFTYIESPDAIGARISRLYSQIESPVMVDVELIVDGVRLSRTYPRSMPDLYRGDELRIATRVRSAGTARITVKGMIAGKPVIFRASAQVKDGMAKPWVGRLWAESRTDDLLEEIALQGEKDELKNEVIDLATAYNFVTPYTSFLAIPESELTRAAKSTLKNARDRKAKILAAHKDAVALSRKAMPPGDPVLKVKAPKNARQVTAYFPFGLEKDLTFDATTEHWKVRFLVPKSVKDGVYEVKIVIVHNDGKIEMATIPYTIDSSGPDFQVETKVVGGVVRIKVTGKELLRAATVLTAAGQRIDLVLSADRMSLEGELELKPGNHQLKVVVMDRARNESDKQVSVSIAKGPLAQVSQ